MLQSRILFIKHETAKDLIEFTKTNDIVKDLIEFHKNTIKDFIEFHYYIQESY